jgi:hypothetical protein
MPNVTRVEGRIVRLNYKKRVLGNQHSLFIIDNRNGYSADETPFSAVLIGALSYHRLSHWTLKGQVGVGSH